MEPDDLGHDDCIVCDEARFANADTNPAAAYELGRYDEQQRCIAVIEAYRKEKEQAAEESASRGAGLSSIGHSFEAKACDAILMAIKTEIVK